MSTVTALDFSLLLAAFVLGFTAGVYWRMRIELRRLREITEIVKTGPR